MQTVAQVLTIAVVDPRRSYRRHQNEIDIAVARVLRSGQYILGDELTQFEWEFARYLGCRVAIGVASGTDALRLALLSLGIKPGDEVITVANAGDPTPMAIWSVGAIPRFVDVDPVTRTMSTEQAQRAMGPRTKALLPVHLYGLPADLKFLSELARSQQIPLIEDACQAHGATYQGHRVGTVGDYGCFSFYPTKNLGALGDGGMVVTNDSALAERARLIRQYGWVEKGRSLVKGICSRLDELQAAILRIKLRYLDDDNARRRSIAAMYRQGLENLNDRVVLPLELPDREHVFHLYVICSSIRDRIRAALAAKGIGTGIHYPIPAHLQTSFEGFWDAKPSLPVTERLAKQVLTLPMGCELSDDEVHSVINAVREVAAECSIDG